VKTNTHFLSRLPRLFLEWEIFETKVVAKIKTLILCSLFFLKKYAVYELMWNNVAQPEETWQYGARAFHTGYPRIQTHTFGICHTYCFSNATMVVLMPLNIMLYVYFPSCLKYWEMFFCKDTYKGTQKNFVLRQHIFYQTNKTETPQYSSRNQHNITPEGA
jgi:hypothetical protein